MGIYKAGSCCVGVLVFHVTGQTVNQVFGDHQKASGSFQQLRLLALHRHQLVDGVEDLLLDARVAVQLLRGDQLLYHLVHALSSIVPVSHGIPQGLAFLVQKQKVHRPGINAHTVRNFGKLPAPFQASDHLPEQTFHVPAETSVLFGEFVFKPIDLFQAQPAFLYPA